MAKVWLDSRHCLVGDSGWLYSSCRDYLDQGDDVTVVAKESNKSVFEFMQGYLEGCERLKVTTECNGQVTIPIHGGPGKKYWKHGAHEMDVSFPLRRELEPIVDTSTPYVCVQPENADHCKTSICLRAIQVSTRGYSVGVNGEYIVPGTEPFHSRPFSEVARLIWHSQGVIAVYSAIALFSSLLGQKVVALAYHGIDFKPGEQPTGHTLPRVILLNNDDLPRMMTAIKNHIGPCLVGHE